MKLNELKAELAAVPSAAPLQIALPDGATVPAHFHITEVGHIDKNFIDCGGQRRTARTCLLQTWMSSERDDGHRLTAGRFARILAIAAPLFTDEELPVEVEYEDGLIAQFPLAGLARTTDGGVVLQLALKHTDCLARDRCGSESGEEGCGCAVPVGRGKEAGCC